MKCHYNADFQRAIPPKEIENGKGENPNYLQDKENNISCSRNIVF